MKNRKLYFGLILTYLTVFLIPAAVNIVQLQDISRTYEQQIAEGVKNSLQTACSMLDQEFAEIDEIIQQLNADTNLQYIALGMSADERYVKIGEWITAQNIIKKLQIPSILSEYYVYFRATGVTVAPKHMFYDKEKWWQFFRYNEAELSRDDWGRLVDSTHSGTILPARTTFQNAGESRMLLYLNSFMTLSGSKGTFVFPIPAASVEELIDSLYIGNEGWAYLYDRDGVVVLDIPASDGSLETVPEEAFGEGDILRTKVSGIPAEVIRAKAPGTGLTMVAVLPTKYISSEIAVKQRSNVLMIAAAVAAGVTYMAVIALRRGRSIDRTIKVLIGSESLKDGENGIWEKNALTYIEDSVGKLVRKNRDLQASLDEKLVLTRELMLGNLLYNPFNLTGKELEEYGISLPRGVLLIACSLQGTDAGDELGSRAFVFYKQVVQDAVSALFDGNVYMYNQSIESGIFVCDVPCDFTAAEGSPLENDLDNLAEDLMNRYGISLRLAVSEVCTEHREIGSSFDRTMELLLYGAAMDRTIMFRSNTTNRNSFYYFPVSLEERLVNAVVSGNEEGVHDQLEEVYQVNVFEREISPEMMHFLVNDMQCAIFRAMSSIGDRVQINRDQVYGELSEMNQEMDILKRFRMVNRMFGEICAEVKNASAGSEEEKKREAIEDYIRENFSDSSLSLIQISEYFGYSSTYFSKLFKSLFGENFAPFLERYRIDEVCRLLSEGETVETAAGKAGYNSVYVMRAAFKRTKGVTPNDWRKLQQEEKK